MSTAAGLVHKGDSKNKKTYATIDINNIYKGKPLEGPKSSASGASKHGVQPLGKVQVGRRMPPPADLPSLKSENLVPQGGQGWGAAKSSQSGAGGNSQSSGSNPQLSDQQIVHQESRSSTLGGGDSASTLSDHHQTAKPTSTGNNASNKTWSSVATAHGQQNGGASQLPFFPGEFPTLKNEPEHKTAGGSLSNADRDGHVANQYGPGPALRPVESNWSKGSAGVGAQLASGSPQANAGSGVNGLLKPRPPSPLGSSPNDPLGMGYPPTISKVIGGPRERPPMTNGSAPLFSRDDRGDGSRMGPRGRGDRYREGGERGGGDHFKSVLKHSTIISDQQLEGFDRILLENETDWSTAKGDVDYNAKLCFSEDEEEDDSRARGRDSQSPLTPREQPSQKQLWTPSGAQQQQGDDWRDGRHGRLKDGRDSRRAPMQQCVFDEDSQERQGESVWRNKHKTKNEMNECVERARMMRRDSERRLSERDDGVQDDGRQQRKEQQAPRRNEKVAPRFARMQVSQDNRWSSGNNRSRSDSSSSNNNQDNGGSISGGSSFQSQQENVWQMNKENKQRSFHEEKSPSPLQSDGMWQSTHQSDKRDSAWQDQGGLFDPSPQRPKAHGYAMPPPITNLGESEKRTLTTLKKDGSAVHPKKDEEKSDKPDEPKMGHKTASSDSLKGSSSSAGGTRGPAKKSQDMDGVGSNDEEQMGFSPRGEPSRRGRGGGRGATQMRGTGRQFADGRGTSGVQKGPAGYANKDLATRSSGGRGRGVAPGRHGLPSSSQSGGTQGSTKEDTPPRFKRHDEYDDEVGDEDRKYNRQRQDRDTARGDKTASGNRQQRNGPVERKDSRKDDRGRDMRSGGQPEKKADPKAAPKDPKKPADIAPVKKQETKPLMEQAVVPPKKDVQAPKVPTSVGIISATSSSTAQKSESLPTNPMKKEGAWGDSDVSAGIEFGTLGESEDLNFKIQSVKKVWDSDQTSHPHNTQAGHGHNQTNVSVPSAQQLSQGGQNAQQHPQNQGSQMSFFQSLEKDTSTSPMQVASGMGVQNATPGTVSSMNVSAQHVVPGGFQHSGAYSANVTSGQNNKQSPLNHQQYVQIFQQQQQQQQQQHQQQQQQKYHSQQTPVQRHHQMTSPFTSIPPQNPLEHGHHAMRGFPHSAPIYNSQFANPPPAAGHQHLTSSQAPPANTGSSDHQYTYFPELYRYQQQQQQHPQQNQYRNFYPSPQSPYNAAQINLHQIGPYPQMQQSFSTNLYAATGHASQSAATSASRFGVKDNQQATGYEQSTPPPYGHPPANQSQQATNRSGQSMGSVGVPQKSAGTFAGNSSNLFGGSNRQYPQMMPQSQQQAPVRQGSNAPAGQNQRYTGKSSTFSHH